MVAGDDDDDDEVGDGDAVVDSQILVVAHCCCYYCCRKPQSDAWLESRRHWVVRHPTDVVVAVDAAKELHDDRAHRADWSRTFSPLLRPRRQRRMGFHQRHFPCWSSLSYCYLVTCEARRRSTTSAATTRRCWS